MNNETITTQKRELVKEKKNGLSVQDIILVAVLLAAGAVLKFFVGSLLNFGGMKPNFIIAMYCLAIMLIKPKLHECAIIGILAGIICQFFPGTPYLNLASELLGAVAMGLLLNLSFLKIKKFDLRPAVCTFLSTIVSGTTFVLLLIYVLKVTDKTLFMYVPMVLGTAIINTVIVQLLFIPLSLAVKKDR